MIGQFRDNQPGNRYELMVDGQLVFADYRKDGEVLYITHVEAPPALRGTGAAGRLMEQIMSVASGERLKVIPICGYAASWIRRHGS